MVLILLAPLIFFLPRVAKSIGAAIVIGIGSLMVAVDAVAAMVGGETLVLELDAINAPFLLAVAVVSAAAAIYAVGATRDAIYKKSAVQLSLHFCSMVVLFYAMVGVLTATERYEFLLWWELMTLSSFILVIFEAQRKEVLHAGISYLILMHISFFFLLAAFAMGGQEEMWSCGGSLGVWLLFLVGFGLKSALFPLHIWLPVTYLNTPSHVTAMMSGVMINMGVYGIIRTTLLFDNLYVVGLILFCVGVFSGLFGIVKAAMHTGLKRLLSYSSVENMGIAVMALGLGVIGISKGYNVLIVCGLGGALLHILVHSAYKSMLFMAAGAVEKATGKSDLNQLGGLLKRMPVTGSVFGIGSLAICAMPPLSGFFSEFSIFYGLFAAVADGVEPIIAIAGIVALGLIGALAVMTFSKAFSMTFLGVPKKCAVRDAVEVSNTVIVAYALPLVSVLFGGVAFAWLIFSDSEIFAVMVNIELFMGGVIGFAAGLWWLRALLQRGRTVDVQPTWGCAFTAANKKMQYSSSSISYSLSETLSSNTKREQATISEIYPVQEPEFHTDNVDRANLVITKTSQRFLHKWTARLAFFQTGKTNHYVLHILLFLLLVLFLSLLGL